MKPSGFFVLLMLTMLLLAGCSSAASSGPVVKDITVEAPEQAPAQAAPASTPEPYPFAESDPGFATLHGSLVVLDPAMMLPGPDDAIFLVPLEPGEGPPENIPQFVVGEVPQADVDESTGEFTFTNIEPGRYLVVVMTINDSQIPARTESGDGLAIFNITEADQDQVMELGNLRFP